ncbi:MAG: thrombospondin type 3 repeat-containing protein [Deltaproteobacteria bacterium]|nr:thrombospondin type 3 repeat-containing protein [Deltaproteobacteria bacterium]
MLLIHHLNTATSDGATVYSDNAEDLAARPLLTVEFAEADADCDGIPDENDNCPDTSNADQADQDLDGLGDVCDPDLDGDGFDNDVDNCPDLENPDQGDLDLDGAGDACDGDADGDGVPNEDDQCEATPYGAMVDAQGCSAAQAIDLGCGTSDEYENLGQYVSCVAHAAQDAVDVGLLSPKEKAAFVRNAARSGP